MAETPVMRFNNQFEGQRVTLAELSSRYGILQSDLAAIDLSDPGAAARLDEIRSEFQILSNERERAINDLNATSNEFNTQPSGVKNEVQPSYDFAQTAATTLQSLNATVFNQLRAKTAANDVESVRRQQALIQTANEPFTTQEDLALAESERLRAAQSVGATPEELAGTVTSPSANTNRGIPSAKRAANRQAIRQDSIDFRGAHEWRVRLALAPGSNYLYKIPNPGILQPLKETDGIIFPYMPAINITYSANYDPQELTHSNYKVFQYRSSQVDSVGITCDFTAQDTNEAAYLLAVIHFFRSVTKMFYGKDQNPRNGTPPPLCYLHGLGQFQFNNHPLVISSFTYNLPTDVDYVRCDSSKFIVKGNGNSIEQRYPPSFQSEGKTEGGDGTAKNTRQGFVPVGGNPSNPNFKNANYKEQPTYVPSKIQLQINAIPIMSRKVLSDNFSLRNYATGDLYRGTKNGSIGVW